MSNQNDFYKENAINANRAKKVIRNFEKDSDGNIIIKDGTYVSSKLNTNQYNFTNGWILLSQPGTINREGVQGTMALVKSYIPDKYPGYYDESDIEILRANNFIMSEIAKQFELEAAEYYNVVFEDSDELKNRENYIIEGRTKKQKIKPNTRYLLTPSFRKNNEKMIHLAELLKKPDELDARKLLNEIRTYLLSENVVASDIDNVLRDFIKQSIFNKFIDFSDEHNLNAGILLTNDKKEKRARLAPCYDLDFSGGVYNITDGGYTKYFFRHNEKGGISLTSILATFFTQFERNYLAEIIPKIDIEEAIKTGEQNGNCKLSEIVRVKYENFFRAQQEELESFYNNYCKNYNNNRTSESKNRDNGEPR